MERFFLIMKGATDEFSPHNLLYVEIVYKHIFEMFTIKCGCVNLIFFLNNSLKICNYFMAIITYSHFYSHNAIKIYS